MSIEKFIKLKTKEYNSLFHRKSVGEKISHFLFTPIFEEDKTPKAGI